MSEDDAISRQDALKSFRPKGVSDEVWQECDAYKRLTSLPSVIVQHKIGRWIYVDSAHEHARCSECDYGDVDLVDGKPHNFCTNCGAKNVIMEINDSK